MKISTRFAIAVALCALPAAAAFAQDAPAGPPAAAPTCELHLWPAERMMSRTSGLLGGMGVIGALADTAAHANRDATNRTQLASALDSPSQLDALQSLNLLTELNLPAGTAVVRHEAPLERHTMNRIKTRRSDSTATCYYELITADVLYMRSPIYGRSLRTLFMLRAFGNDQSIDFEYKAWGGNGLSHFPPREGEDVTVAIQELVDVFKRNFQEYANNERQAAARRAGGRR
ncbi:MAG TPA: hypothetical protein VGW40_05925 [Allosphingosinicella sp.]|nr:hypothetical protein [Allosphingosinicella sp.]